MRKKALSLALAFIMISVILPFAESPALAADSVDSASTWAREGITEALSKGFIPTDIQSNYTVVITRQEFCRMAVMWVEYATGKDIDSVLTEKGLTRNQNAFSDTKDPDILAAFALGITSGTAAPTSMTPGTFTPNGEFSREQAATMIMNTCKAIGADVNNPPTADFNDLNTASSWALNGVNYVRANGIMQGTSTNPPMFSPKTNYTREQSIITFNNINPIGILDSNPPVNIDIIGTWVLESMDMFDISLDEEEIVDNFPLGMPYFKFNDNRNVELGNFSVYRDFDKGTVFGTIEIGTYLVSGNIISIVGSMGGTQILTLNDDNIVWETNDTVMRFSIQ